MGFLRPVKMVKVGLVGLKADRERVLTALHDLGVVQVEPLRKEAAALHAPEVAGELQRQVADQLLRFRTLHNALPATPAGPPRSFPTLEDVMQATRDVPIDAEVESLKGEEDRLLTEQRELAETVALLTQHRRFGDPLGMLRSERMLAFFGDAPPDRLEALSNEVRQIGEAAFVRTEEDRDRAYFLVAVPREHADAIARLAQQRGIHLVAVPPLEGRIADELPRLATRRAEVEHRLGEIRARLQEIAEVWYPSVLAIEEALGIHNRIFEAWGRMGAGAVTFSVEGWMPERAYARLDSLLHRITEGRAHLYRIPTDEDAPTLMDNPSGIRWFEFYIRFYALPRGNEFDPTWIFALAFPIFFGFMLGDWGYGLVILIISAWLAAGYPGARHLPNFVKALPKMIMGANSMRSLAWTLLPSAAIAMALGIVYNQVFGFHLTFYTALADPVRDVGTLLVIAGFIGLAMVTIGFFLGALKAYFHRHYHVVGVRVGGIIFAWGISLAGLTVIHAHGINFGSSSLDALIGVTLAGLGTMIAFEGAQGLMGVIEVVSHVLSYTRLVGILLAGVILATVIDTQSQAIIAAYPYVGWVGGLLLLIVGQVFNLILAVFEPGIQGARLIFVEHFSKFYEGNGRAFAPLASTRRFTTPVQGDVPAPVPLSR
jgi:V/A-type H+-transporting ATPase subunit I